MHMHSTRIICDISRASDGRVVSPKYLRDLVFPSVMLPISRRFAKKEHQESSDILAFSRSRRMHHVLDRDWVEAWNGHMWCHNKLITKHQRRLNVVCFNIGDESEYGGLVSFPSLNVRCFRSCKNCITSPLNELISARIRHVNTDFNCHWHAYWVKNFSRWHFEIFFLVFLESRICHFIQNAKKNLATHRVGKSKNKNTQNTSKVICWRHWKDWTFYLELIEFFFANFQCGSFAYLVEWTVVPLLVWRLSSIQSPNGHMTLKKKNKKNAVSAFCAFLDITHSDQYVLLILNLLPLPGLIQQTTGWWYMYFSYFS